MQKSDISVLEEIMPVTSADTDFTKSLRPSSLINMLIQIAWHHAEILGFGMEFLHQNELVWMLSRMHLKIYNKPFWNNQLKLRSWPKGIHRLFYLRDFEVSDRSNQTVAKATSEWLIIDLKSKRPKLYQPENNIFQENKDRHAIENLVPNLKSGSNHINQFSNTVVYSDIDLNNHLTTTRYIDWMFDTFDITFLEKCICRDIIINFMRELPFGTEVTIKRHEISFEEQYLFEFQSTDGMQIYFRGQLRFTST